AVRVQGRKAYERARAGEEFEIAPREVTVYGFELLWREDDRAAFRIECSAGTYVRSLIADLGDGYCVELRRTRIGPFSVEGARPRRGPAARPGARLPAARRRRSRRRLARRPRPVDPRAGRRRARPAGRRRRPGGNRRAPRGRPPEARRRLPRVKVTGLSDVE